MVNIGNYYYSLEFSTFLLAVFTAVLAAATGWLAWTSYRSISLLAKSVGANSLQAISNLLGTFEGIGDLRGKLREKLTTVHGGKMNLVDFYSLAEAEELRKDIQKLSAAFDRSAWAITSFLSRKQMPHFLNVLGDAYIDFWAICFGGIKEDQDRRGDYDNRMYFEHLAYTAYEYFSRGQGVRHGHPASFHLYAGDSPIAVRRQDRASLLTKRLGKLL